MGCLKRDRLRNYSLSVLSPSRSFFVSPSRTGVVFASPRWLAAAKLLANAAPLTFASFFSPSLGYSNSRAANSTTELSADFYVLRLLDRDAERKEAERGKS